LKAKAAGAAAAGTLVKEQQRAPKQTPAKIPAKVSAPAPAVGPGGSARRVIGTHLEPSFLELSGVL